MESWKIIAIALVSAAVLSTVALTMMNKSAPSAYSPAVIKAYQSW
jgi:hypothetical protein